MIPAFVTGVGSWPGVDDVAAIVRDCSDVPYLAELPERGYGADMIGRTMALVARVSTDFAIETTPSGWRLARPGRDLRRASAFLDRDLDAIHEAFDGYTGPFGVSVAGPWTLASAVDLAAGDRLLRDPGACRDLATALAQAAAELGAEVRRRIPGAAIVLRLDEPSLPAVLRGSVRTPSGYDAYRAVEPNLAAAALTQVAGDADAVLHCCADEMPWDVAAAAGFRGLSVPASAVVPERAGEHIDRGGYLVLGIDEPSTRELAALGNRVGYSSGEWASHIGVSPTCGLVGMSLSQARARMERLHGVAASLREGD